ncbi:hypothetical protein D3C81_1470520 [compost metagenome]
MIGRGQIGQIKAASPTLQHSLKLLHINTVMLHWNTSNFKSLQLQIFDCCVMGWIFTNCRSGACRRTECRQYNVKAFRKSASDQHILAAYIDAFILHVTHQVIDQRLIAFRIAVVEQHLSFDGHSIHKGSLYVH